MCISIDVAFRVERLSFIRLLDMPAEKWTKDKSERRWATRPSSLILRGMNVAQGNETRRLRNVERARKRVLRKQEFLQSFRVSSRSQSGNKSLNAIGDDLRFWAEHGSWSACKRCGSLQSKKLLPWFRSRRTPASSTSCVCKAKRYKVPHPKNIPSVLKNLSTEEIHALRPFRAFSGKYTRVMFGYRVREEPFKIKWAFDDVEVKIRKIQNPQSRQRTKAAFDYLMRAANCSYQKFVHMHRSHVREPWIFELFSHPAFHGVETALWPHLYHNNTLCESLLEGQDSRLSGKVSFMTKVMSCVPDYAIEYDLLHYHYDRWLFKTITGAINTAKKSNCSPAAALEAKTFSHQYWATSIAFSSTPCANLGSPRYSSPFRPLNGPFRFHRG